jgi:uncharacterized membrane protein
MLRLSVVLVGIFVLMIAYMISGVFIVPLLDIVHNSLNQSQPPLPAPEYYLARVVSIFRNPFLFIIVALGILLGAAREHWQNQWKGAFAYFLIPVLFSLFLFVAISLQDYAQQGWRAVVQAFVRAAQFLLPFVLAWFLYEPARRLYQRIGERVS